MAHHYTVPQVREIVSQSPRALDAGGAQRPVTQRELVAASLLLRPPSSLPKKV